MLLLDNNISFKLSYDKDLVELFPGMIHIFSLKLQDTEDHFLWDYALKRDLIIISKDNDFLNLIIQNGFPPSVVKISTGNCKTSIVKSLLIKNYSVITKLKDKPGLLIIS